MAEVTISTFQPNPMLKYMQVDSDVINIPPDGGTITFTNTLTPPEVVAVRFFKDQADKTAGTAISGFCGGSSDSLTVPKSTGGPGSGEADCSVTNPDQAYYLYDISDASTGMPKYVKLDPVLIIDKPGFISPGTDEGNFAFLRDSGSVGLVALFVGIAIGWLVWGRSRKSDGG